MCVGINRPDNRKGYRQSIGLIPRSQASRSGRVVVRNSPRASPSWQWRRHGNHAHAPRSTSTSSASPRRSSSFQNIDNIVVLRHLDLRCILYLSFFKPSKLSPWSYETELIVRNNRNSANTARVFTNEIDSRNLRLVFH